MCQFWDETELFWSEDGCVLSSYNQAEGYIVCNCTHLTTFSCPLVPPVVIPEWTVLTWDNIKQEPLGAIVLASLTGLTLLTRSDSHYRITL